MRFAHRWRVRGRPPVKGGSERSERGVSFSKIETPHSPSAHDPLIRGSAMARLYLIASLLLLSLPPLAHAFTESPALHKLVAEGKLPPVEKRLPAEPLVVPIPEGETPGQYARALKGHKAN